MNCFSPATSWKTWCYAGEPAEATVIPSCLRGMSIAPAVDKRKCAFLVKQFCQGKIMKRGHAHMKLLLRKNEVCTIGASVEVRMGKREHLFIRHWRISSTDVDFTRRKTDFILPAGDEVFLHFAFCILHSAFCILHSAFCILHFAFCILHSAFCILHSA